MITKIVNESFKWKDWENIDGFLLLLLNSNNVDELVKYIKDSATLDEIKNNLNKISNNMEMLAKKLR